MDDWTKQDYAREAAYNAALEAIAMGATKDATLEALGDMYGTKITVAEIEQQAMMAKTDAIRQGVEREDIDPSWF